MKFKTIPAAAIVGAALVFVGCQNEAAARCHGHGVKHCKPVVCRVVWFPRIRTALAHCRAVRCHPVVCKPHHGHAHHPKPCKPCPPPKCCKPDCDPVPAAPKGDGTIPL